MHNNYHLKKCASKRSYYLIEHENHLPKLQLKGESFDKSTQEKDTPLDNTDEWLQLLDETSPIDMLASWSGSEPTQSQKV